MCESKPASTVVQCVGVKVSQAAWLSSVAPLPSPTTIVSAITFSSTFSLCRIRRYIKCRGIPTARVIKANPRQISVSAKQRKGENHGHLMSGPLPLARCYVCSWGLREMCPDMRPTPPALLRPQRLPLSSSLAAQDTFISLFILATPVVFSGDMLQGSWHLLQGFGEHT